MHESLPSPLSDLESLWNRPGFMIRRAHQIAQTLFLADTGELRITSTQYGVLRILQAHPGLDQIGVARLLGQDRSTAALVINNLMNDGFVVRERSGVDRRRFVLTISQSGSDLLYRLEESVRTSHDRLLSVFSKGEAETFIRLLRRLVDHFNDESRTPLDPAAAERVESL